MILAFALCYLIASNTEIKAFKDKSFREEKAVLLESSDVDSSDSILETISNSPNESDDSNSYSSSEIDDSESFSSEYNETDDFNETNTSESFSSEYNETEDFNKTNISNSFSETEEEPTSSRTPSKSSSPSKSPTPTPSATPDTIPDPDVDIINSTSNIFNLTSTGAITENAQSPINASDKPDQITKVEFSQKSITISQQQQGGIRTENPIYFSAKSEESKIKIDKSVTDTIVGVTTDLSPTVEVAKAKNPLSLLNNNTDGQLKISFSEDEIQDENPNKINLQEVNNRRGNFNLVVPESIDLVLFTRILMSRESSFIARKSAAAAEARSNKAILSDEETVKVEVTDLINITSKSDSRLSKVHLESQLYIYDDSHVTFTDDSLLNESSYINVIIQKSKPYSSRTPPIIRFEGPLLYIPNNFTLRTLSSDIPIDISNFPLIGATGEFSSCEKLRNRIFIDKEKSTEKIEGVCKNQNGMNTFFLTAKEKDADEKDDKKLSSGALAAIIVACIVVLIIIIAIIVIFVYRKKHENFSKGVHDVDDVSN